MMDLGGASLMESGMWEWPESRQGNAFAGGSASDRFWL